MNSRRVEQLFEAPSHRFEVPDFQRRYAWGKEEVDALMDDLYGGDDWWNADQSHEPYFLGSIVLSGESPFRVLDGQQRLATLSLVLAALKHRLQPVDAEGAAQLQAYLAAGGFGRRKEFRVRLQPDDRPLFERLLGDPDTPRSRPEGQSPLSQAMRSTLAHIDKCIDRGSAQGLTPLESMEAIARRLLASVELVEIHAPSEADAFRLFETLNDRGLPLNASDLIKNKLFARAGTDYLESVKREWLQLQRALTSDEILPFLRHYWAAFREPVRKDRLYDRYKDFASSLQGKEILDFVQDLQRSANHYRHIARPHEDCPWGRVAYQGLKRLNELRARSSRPLLLLTARRTEPSEFAAIVELCETAQVRHTLVGSGYPAELERALLHACSRLRGAAQDCSATAIILSSLAEVVTSDTDFSEQFSKIRVTSIGSKWRAILVRLNDTMSAGESVVAGPRTVHVEHILPRTPSVDALEEAKVGSDEAAELSTHLGNLTLLSGKRNQSISNRAFSRKRAAFASSDLAINRSIAQRERWGPEEIRERDQEIARLAVIAWPWPTSQPSKQVSSRTSIPESTENTPRQEAPSPLPIQQVAPPLNGLSQLEGNPKLLGTVWVPRILWSLVWLNRQGENGGANAARIASVFSIGHGIRIAAPNVARAFREHGKRMVDDGLIVQVESLRYVLGPKGQARLESLFETDDSQV
ncbi:MAG: DUF262 domain-containing HNH endonuclease family protein [Myxococcales bacterium]|nr:DUF262 domain-containing HNH endonuclease family protein [Myxococcales bacterium]